MSEGIFLKTSMMDQMKRNNLWMLAAILTCGLMVTSCSNNDEPSLPRDAVEEQLSQMTLREKVGQMFYVRMETLDTTIHWNTYADLQENPILEVNQTMRDVNEHYPVGGLILYAWNIDNEAQLSTLIAQIRSLNGQPLLCIDEEGGRVARIANNPNFNVKKYESMSAIGATGDPNNAYECGNTNVIIGPRAFSDDPAVAAPMVTHYLQGLKDAGVTGCIKHFPGHGDTKADTHFGYASTQKTWAEMMDCEMVTFKAGIQWGCQLIMTAHIGAPNVTGSDVPSTMSPIILQDKLRGELGYQNIIINDGMEMGSITQQYTSAEAAVGSIQAGVDIVLGPKNLVEAFDAVMAAVDNGTISEERINQSVRRILKLKMK